MKTYLYSFVFAVMALISVGKTLTLAYPEALMAGIKALSKDAEDIFRKISRAHIPAFVKGNLLTQHITAKEKNEWHTAVKSLENFINTNAPLLKKDFADTRNGYDALMNTVTAIFGQFALAIIIKDPTDKKEKEKKEQGIEISGAWLKAPGKYPKLIKDTKEKVNWNKVNTSQYDTQLKKLRSEQLPKIEAVIKKMQQETQKYAFKTYSKAYKDATYLLWYFAETLKDSLLKATDIDINNLKIFMRTSY